MHGESLPKIAIVLVCSSTFLIKVCRKLSFVVPIAVIIFFENCITTPKPLPVERSGRKLLLICNVRYLVHLFQN